jgi:hypothetical protein
MYFVNVITGTVTTAFTMSSVPLIAEGSNLTGLATDGLGNLYGLLLPPSASPNVTQLVTIDTTSGAVTIGPTLTDISFPDGIVIFQTACIHGSSTGCNSQTSHFNKTRPAQRLHATTRKKLAKCDHRQSVMPGQ